MGQVSNPFIRSTGVISQLLKLALSDNAVHLFTAISRENMRDDYIGVIDLNWIERINFARRPFECTDFINWHIIVMNSNSSWMIYINWEQAFNEHTDDLATTHYMLATNDSDSVKCINFGGYLFGL